MIKNKKLFSLAKEIQEIFPQFYLAGGTALMFKYEHRVSIDIDFFCQKSFSYKKLSLKTRKFFNVENEQHLGDNIDFFINDIKV